MALPQPNRIVRPLRWAGLGALVALLAACSGEHPQTTFEPVSEFGETLNSLFANTFWWTIGILILVELLILYFIFKYRERPGAPHPEQIHGNTKVEILWTIIPAVIVLFIAIPTIRVTISTQQKPPEDALIVEVIGHQWWWEFRYPEYNVVTANELVLPVGRNIDLKMHSADVIHSFWVPRVGGKRDVNPHPRAAPGEHAPKSNHIQFNIKEPGYYLGQCAEYCGTSHAIMRTAINAVTTADFDQWVSSMGGAYRGNLPNEQQPVQGSNSPVGGPANTPAQAGPQPATIPAAPPAGAQQVALSPEAQRGQQLFTSKVCIACHTIQGTTARGVLGPNLTRFGARRYVGAGAKPNTIENVIAWITNPSAVKPGTLMPGAKVAGGGMAPTGLSDEEVRAIATYLTSLK